MEGIIHRVSGVCFPTVKPTCGPSGPEMQAACLRITRSPLGHRELPWQRERAPERWTQGLLVGTVVDGERPRVRREAWWREGHLAGWGPV